ncbi:hypothetical protein AAHC03_024381 [Spirometra sp. Aus1]
MTKRRPAGTLFANVRYKFALYMSLVNFACIIVTFVTPYWLQSWPRLHTPIKRLGLWEFCVNGFTARLDPLMVSHFDCWWIFSPYLSRIITSLTPWWFIIIQVLMSIAIFIQCLMHFVFIFYWCYPISNVERRLRFLKFGAVCQGITFACLLPSIIIFGVEHKNPNWMPYPSLNWASWSYGVAVLSTFFSFFVLLAFESTWREAKRTLETAGYEFPMSAVLRKREKKALLDAQEKAAEATALEPLAQNAIDAGVPLSETPAKTSAIGTKPELEVSAGSAIRSRRDPRFGYPSGVATASVLSGKL